MISVTETIRDMVAYKKIDFFKQTHTVIAIFDVIGR